VCGTTRGPRSPHKHQGVVGCDVSAGFWLFVAGMEQMEVPVPETAHVRIPCVLGSPDCEVVVLLVAAFCRPAQRLRHVGIVSV
jgi:hypothetical protein